MKFDRKRWIRTAALGAAVLILGGCQGTAYEPVKLAASQEDRQEETETAATETAVTETAETATAAEETDIVLEPEAEHADSEPLAESAASSADTDSGAQADTLLFSGDVLLSDHVLNAYERGGGIGGVLDPGYRQVIHDAGFFMVNQEFPFSDRGTAAPDKQYTFRLPPEKVSIFQEMEIDGVTLANNHALDFGTEALLDSCGVLDAAGILHTGAGADLAAARIPVTAQVGEKSVAVIGATRVIPVADWAAGNGHPGMLAAYDPTALIETIRTLRPQYDYLVVMIHWGIERADHPEEYQRTLGKSLIDAGADLVVGSHPHVLQGVEYYQGKPIVYSLGNFVFGSSIPKTALLEVSLKTETPALRLIPGTSSAGYTRMLSDEAAKQEFYQYIEGISFDVSIGGDGVLHPKEAEKQSP